MFLHSVPGLCVTELHAKSSLPFLNKQHIQTKETLLTFSPFPPPHTHTCIVSAHEALSVVFWSRFPSLSTHKAWERHKEEADVGLRGSLELFWPVKVKETWHATCMQRFLLVLLVLTFTYVELHPRDNGTEEGGVLLLPNSCRLVEPLVTDGASGCPLILMLWQTGYATRIKTGFMSCHNTEPLKYEWMNQMFLKFDIKACVLLCGTVD